MARHSMQLNLPPTPLEDLRTPTQGAADSLRSWRELVDRARQRAGLSMKAMATDLGISPQQFGDQMAGRENCHLSLWRMHALPREFWVELVTLICEFHDITINGTQRDAEDAAIGRLAREIVERVTARKAGA